MSSGLKETEGPRVFDKALFIGEEEDVEDRSFGPLLPGRREWARAMCQFVGYVLPFDPAALQDRKALRERLGYGSGPLVVCSIGGTSIGRELLELCGRAFSTLKESLPDVHMVLVCGPRLDRDSLVVPDGVEARGYVPDLHEHFAASDLAIVQGGGTTTLELTALGRPFVYFPIEGHFEQSQISRRLERYGAGLKMTLSETSPDRLAAEALRMMGAPPSVRALPTDGGRRAAELCAELL